MIDWEAIKTEYITTDLSYRQLGQKHGLSHQMIAVRGKSGGWVELRRQYKAKVTAKTVEKMASKKASQRVRVADLADKLLDKLEQAIDELDLRTTAYKVKTVDGNREEVVEYQEATQLLEEFQQIVLSIVSRVVIPVLPFFIALAVARLAQPAVDFLQRRGRLPRWLVKRCSFQKGYWK